MKKKLFLMLLCVTLVFAMAAPAFAVSDATQQESGIVNYSLDDDVQPMPFSLGQHTFRLEETNLYLNVNNSAYPNKAMTNDTVIVWTKNPQLLADELWIVAPGTQYGLFVRTKLNLDLALNINHVANKCTLFPPTYNFTDNKSDSAVTGPFEGAGGILLWDWNLFLTNSVPVSGSTSYWTSNGSIYICE